MKEFSKMTVVYFFKDFFAGGKKRTRFHPILLIGLCVTLQVTTGRAGSAEPSVEQKQAHSEEAVVAASGGKWLPIPIFLTEPAFGYGLGFGLGYIHPEKEKTEAGTFPILQTPTSTESGKSGQKPPPTMTGVAGGYTDKDTWFGAVGHSTKWRADTIRYAGALVYADVKSTYYILDRPFDFGLLGFALYQDLKFRLGNSQFFVGSKLLYMETESGFDSTNGENTQIPLGDISSRDVGLALEASFDSRDNVFTPNSGQLLQLSAWRHDEGIGSDYNYWKGTLKALSFYQLHPNFVLGLRLEASVVDGRLPFYAYPWISLRGVPALRYQGKRVGMAEVEGRWDIMPRWALLGFLGTGAVAGDDPAFKTEDNIIAGGVGGRYLFMPEQGLWLGLDVARGPEDWYGYITVGHAW